MTAGGSGLSSGVAPKFRYGGVNSESQSRAVTIDALQPSAELAEAP